LLFTVGVKLVSDTIFRMITVVASALVVIHKLELMAQCEIVNLLKATR
jgi:hypothetical protein